LFTFIVLTLTLAFIINFASECLHLQEDLRKSVGTGIKCDTTPMLMMLIYWAQIQIPYRKTDGILDSSKEVGLEANAEQTK
jgi:hypothetical protein